MSPIAALAEEAVQSRSATSIADSEAVPGDPTAAPHRSIGEWLPIGIWAGLIVAAGGTGAIYGKAHPEWRLNAAPFFADVGSSPVVRLVPAVLVALAVWVALRRVPVRWLVFASAAGAGLWAVSLMWADGQIGVSGIAGPYDYLGVVPSVSALGPAEFISSFSFSLADYPIHVQGHPPGMPILLWALSSIGLSGTPVVIGLAVGGWAAAVGAALSSVRRIAGDERLRRAAPWVALTPAALWVASADAFFAGLVASALALLIAAVFRKGALSRALAGAGGAVGAFAVLFSYGAAPLGLIALTTVVVYRRLDLAAWAAAGAAAVIAAAAVVGFWWVDGLAATGERYWAGVAGDRPFSYFVWANLAVAGVIVGPAALRGLGSLTHRSAGGWVVLSAVGALLLADLSGLSKGEVERIWLPFVPWIALSGGWLPRKAETWLLAATVGMTFALQLVLRSPW